MSNEKDSIEPRTILQQTSMQNLVNDQDTWNKKTTTTSKIISMFEKQHSEVMESLKSDGFTKLTTLTPSMAGTTGQQRTIPSKDTMENIRQKSPQM